MKEVFRQILDFGMADILNEDNQGKADDCCVAAGDPVSHVNKFTGLIDVKGVLLPDGLKQFVTCGNSMSPKNIDDGDNLIGRRFEMGTDRINEGDFLILKVDPEYYDGETPNYLHKLRCAIMTVPKDWSEQMIIDRMMEMDSQPEIWLRSYQKGLREKLEKARRHYKDTDLILSCTFKNGKLCYSFHDLRFVEYKVVSQIKRDNPEKIVNLLKAA